MTTTTPTPTTTNTQRPKTTTPSPTSLSLTLPFLPSTSNVGSNTTNSTNHPPNHVVRPAATGSTIVSDDSGLYTAAMPSDLEDAYSLPATPQSSTTNHNNNNPHPYQKSASSWSSPLSLSQSPNNPNHQNGTNPLERLRQDHCPEQPLASRSAAASKSPKAMTVSSTSPPTTMAHARIVPPLPSSPRQQQQRPPPPLETTAPLAPPLLPRAVPSTQQPQQRRDNDDQDDDHDDSTTTSFEDDDDSNPNVAHAIVVDGLPPNDAHEQEQQPTDWHTAFVAKEAARTANCAGYTVLTALLVVGALVAVVAYFYTLGDERDAFEHEYETVAHEIQVGLERNAYSLHQHLTWMGTVVAQQALLQLQSQQSQTVLFVTVPTFVDLVRPLQYAWQVPAVAYAPWLTTEALRNAWGPYSQGHLADWYDPSSRAVSSTDNKEMFEETTTNDDSTGLYPEIWRYDNSTTTTTTKRIPDQGQTPPWYAPLWMSSFGGANGNHDDDTTIPSTISMVNYNLNTNLWYQSMAQTSSRNATWSFLSEPVPLNQSVYDFFGAHDQNHDENVVSSVPHSIGIVPVAVDPTQTTDETNTAPQTEEPMVIGHLSAAIPWTMLFSNILQDHQNGLRAVVDSCNNGKVVNTFELDGKTARFVGPGDLHSDSYEDQMVRFFFYGFVPRSHLPVVAADDERPSSEGEEEEAITFCKHTIRIYPTSTYEESFESSNPIIYAVAAAALVAFAIGLVLCYDNIFRKQQNVVLGEAERSNAIVASLFPGKVARRLFLDTSSHGGGTITRGGGGGPRSVRSDGGRSTGSVNLLNFMNKGEVEIAEASRPIAELFPEATILFGDIAGFTAWSSIREPSQVFMLLESIFQAFDNIAKSFGVFKVETVGDCYVACCGVPEPNEDHATVMAQFARECLRKFQTVVQDLELKLGPDTGELAMRFGLNSGPVTAGVLRGERARFQLFGDTVNTAARMESTGARNRIHLSEQTARILIGHGRGSWVQPREDKVEAKGKGILSTYWLQEEVAAPRLWQSQESERGGMGGDGNSVDGDVMLYQDSSHAPEDDLLEEMDVAGTSVIGDCASSTASLDAMKGSSHHLRLGANMDPMKGSNHHLRSSANSRHARKGIAESESASVTAAANAFRKKQRLVDWNTELLLQLLKQVVARRFASAGRRAVPTPDLGEMAQRIGEGRMPVDEVLEIIVLPDFDERASTTSNQVAPDSVVLSPEVTSQCRNYVALIASMYRDNPFHNFEHASHVTMSVSKLLSRIVAPEIDRSNSSDDDLSHQAASPGKRLASLMHDHTYGITSDPLTQFAVVLSALIHDVDHRGVPNFLLIQEQEQMAAAYQNKSVAEQNSVDLAWKALMRPEFGELRSCIFSNVAELRRFRALLINSVIATDIFDKELGTLRKNRWAKAFADTTGGGSSNHHSSSNQSLTGSHSTDGPHTTSNSHSTSLDSKQDVNRKATIVIEHLIQASDVAHTMQHWHVYQKWNERLFQEMYQVYWSGRNSSKDPSVGWYQGELGFFDHYIIPLAKKLKECGVFGVASDEYLNYAMENRREWAAKGQELVTQLVEKYRPSSQKDNAVPSSDQHDNKQWKHESPRRHSRHDESNDDDHDDFAEETTHDDGEEEGKVEEVPSKLVNI